MGKMKIYASQRSWSGCVPVCLRVDSAENDESVPVAKKSRSIKERLLGSGDRKTGGIRAISFVLANESFERLATFGLFANFMMYLIKIYNLDQVSAANLLSIWFGVTNFAPLAGAFIADAYTGRFWIIGFASFFSLLGMVTLTLTAWAPQLHPPTCMKDQTLLGHCIGPTGSQMGALILGLVLLSIGSGGIRPCSIPFGVDQFDQTTDRGRKGIASFFNWYYTTFTIIVILAQTVILYIQDQVSWVLGFGIPTLLMGVSIFLFFFGARYYNYVKPEGSAFTGMAQVAVAAFKKRHLKVPEFEDENGDMDKRSIAVIYDPPVKGNLVVKLVRTRDYRFLDKATVVTSENELTHNGEPVDKWKLTSIQNVEEFKCLIRVLPIWACGVIGLTAITQQWTFNVSQALIMDRHIRSFEVPAGTVTSVICLLTVVIFIPVYDRCLVPAFRKITGHETGITLLQRIGIGIIFAVASMAVAGTVERIRRQNALSGEPAMSAFWLSPQLILMGLCEAFNMIGLIEFFNRQFPEHMRSIANALFPLSFGMASYLSTAIMNSVRRATVSEKLLGGWLDKDLDHGRYDYFYLLLAGLGVVNLALFVFCASRFRYKEISGPGDGVSDEDVEMSGGANERDGIASLRKA